MNTDLFRQFMGLAFILLIAALVWNYYRRSTFPASERYSTFGPRFWSAFVDACVLWPVGFITWAILSLNVPRVVAALLLIVQSLAWLAYTVVMHASCGQTIGKMVTKVRVLDHRSEGTISWPQAWLREGIPTFVSLGFLGYDVYSILVGSMPAQAVANGQVTGEAFWLLSALPGLWFVAEVLTMLTNEKRRALHDFIAGTVVVRTNAEEKAVQSGPLPNAGSAAASIVPLS